MLWGQGILLAAVGQQYHRVAPLPHPMPVLVSVPPLLVMRTSLQRLQTELWGGYMGYLGVFLST